jgi:hypothetical protein
VSRRFIRKVAMWVQSVSACPSVRSNLPSLAVVPGQTRGVEHVGMQGAGCLRVRRPAHRHEPDRLSGVVAAPAQPAARAAAHTLTGVAMTLGMCWQNPALAGAYVFADGDRPDGVTHPQVYSGTGGTLADLTICIDISVNPALAAQAEGALHKVVATHNRFVSLPANNLAFDAATDIPSGQVDFESTLLHEVGHCIGLAHPNHATESGIAEPGRNGTKSAVGANAVFDQDAGTDGLHGSRDDVRGDDINLHWYIRGQNNPGLLPATIDTSTMTRELDALPAGHLFAANADRGVMNALGFSDSEAVMQQGAAFNEAQRHYQHDDLATLRLARAGLDRIAGTSDDYRYSLRYVGQLNNPPNADCNLRVRLDTSTGFAACGISGQQVGIDDRRITSANLRFNSNTAWFFTPGPNTLTTITADTPDPSPVGQPYTVSVTVREAAGIAITGEPRGTVVVTDGAPAPNTARCTITLTGAANETGSCQLTSTVPGTRDLTADFVGFAGWDGSRGTAPHGTSAPDLVFRNGFE